REATLDQPLSLRSPFERRVVGDELVACELRLAPRPTRAGEILLRRPESEFHMQDTLADERVLGRTPEPDRQVGVAACQIDALVVRDTPPPAPRMTPRDPAHRGSPHPADEGLARRQPDRSRGLLVARADLALDVAGAVLDRSRLDEELLPGGGQRHALAPPP